MPLSTFLNGRASTRERGLLFLTLSETAIIQRPSASSDSGGGATRTWVNAGTVPCHIRPLTPRPIFRMTGGQIDERSTHVITTPVGTDVSSSDRIVILGRGTFEVTQASERTAEMSTAVDVMRLELS